MRVFPLVPLVAGLHAACASAPAPRSEEPQAQRPTAAVEPDRVEVARIIVTPDGTASVDELFALAEAKLQEGDPVGAAEGFERVFELDPDGPWAAEALFGAGAAHEATGDLAAATARLEQLARRFADHPLARQALVRAVRIHASRDAWRRAGEAAQLLLGRYGDLSPLESVVARGGRALALVAEGALEAASQEVERGRTVIEQHRLDAAGRLPRDLALVYFALGEIRRLRAEQITFVPVPADFGARLESRCQLLLDAQSAYSDSMRAYDPHWSAMAGYRVGELYQKLHADLMQVPPPASADTPRRRQLFEGAVRLRYSILLQKAHAMMRHTLAMCERAGEQSRWAARAERAKRAIERSIQAEQQAIDRLPYSRAELQGALDRLTSEKSRQGFARGPQPGSPPQHPVGGSP